MLKSKKNERINKVAIYNDLQSKINNRTIDFYFANICKMIEELENNKINTCKTFNNFLLAKGYSRGGSFYKYKNELMNLGLLKIENKNLVFIVPQKYLEICNTNIDAKNVEQNKSASTNSKSFIEHAKESNKEYASLLNEKHIRDFLDGLYKNSRLKIASNISQNDTKKQFVIDLIQYIEQSLLADSQHCYGREYIINKVNGWLKENEKIELEQEKKNMDEHFRIIAEKIDRNEINEKSLSEFELNNK